MVIPEGTQEGNKECLLSSSHQTAATPTLHLEETPDEKTQFYCLAVNLELQETATNDYSCLQHRGKWFVRQVWRFL